jgi:hypothetical protein
MRYLAANIYGFDPLFDLVKQDPFDRIGEEFVDACLRVRPQLKLHIGLPHHLGDQVAL